MEVLISTLKEMVSFIKDWGALIIAGISLLVAIISLSKSSKAQRLQNKVNELELKIKQDELDKITKEKEDAELACVEARFITVGKGKHRLKVWNSGNATAYHVSARFDGDVGIMIMDSQQNSVDLNALATSVGVPFRLVENQAASAQTADVTFLTLPVSTTGKVPAAGRYNALAILRVEYQ